jgi:hypothetical protein
VKRNEGRPLAGPAPTTARISLHDANASAGIYSSADVGAARRQAAVGRAERLGAWRRAQWAHDLRCRRRISGELDRLLSGRRPDGVGVLHRDAETLRSLLRRLGVDVPQVADDGDPYADAGLTLGMPERVAAGRAGLGAG